MNPCPYTNDGDCDEPNGLGFCAWGTDTADCSNPYSNYGSGSGYAGGGYSGGGTAGGGGGGLMNPCPYTNDGDCDEPNGLGYCAWGTDVNDCANPYSNYGNGSGYAGGSRPGGNNPQPGAPNQTPGWHTGVAQMVVSGGTCMTHPFIFTVPQGATARTFTVNWESVNFGSNCATGGMEPRGGVFLDGQWGDRIHSVNWERGMRPPGRDVQTLHSIVLPPGTYRFSVGNGAGARAELTYYLNFQ